MAKKYKNQIVTGGWVSPPQELFSGTNYITDEQYSFAKECKMDYLFTLYENPTKYGNEYILSALKAAEKNGIGLFVGDYRFFDADSEQTKKLLSVYEKYESFAGLNLYDEPGIAKFEEIENARKKINQLSDCTCFVNLLPKYALSSVLKGTYKAGDTGIATKEEYQEYLKKFIHAYKSDILSYDFYPFRWEYGKCDEDFYYQIAVVYSAAKKLGVPMWTFIQITSWNKEIREMTDAEIQWQVYLSLALGAKGIMYFTYWLPFSSEQEHYTQAIIEANGEKGAPFNIVKSLNTFIETINPVMGEASFYGCCCGREIDKKIPDLYERISSFDFNGTTCSVFAGDNVIASLFKDQNDRACLLVVNTSFKGCESVNLNFSDAVQLSVVDKNQTNDVFINKELKFGIEKCSGVFIYIK